LIIFYSVAGLIFILDLFFKFTKPESRLYRTKLVAFYLIAIAYIFALSYDTYKFYFAQNSISSGIDKDFLLEIQNNSNNGLDLKFFSIKEKDEKYKRYYINKINIYEPNHLLQNIIIKSGEKSSFNLKIPYSAFILIQDNISSKSIKIYRTDIKIYKLYEDIIKNRSKGINNIIFFIIFLGNCLNKKIITKKNTKLVAINEISYQLSTLTISSIFLKSLSYNLIFMSVL